MLTSKKPAVKNDSMNYIGSKCLAFIICQDTAEEEERLVCGGFWVFQVVREYFTICLCHSHGMEVQ